jgi:hypothetical protein
MRMDIHDCKTKSDLITTEIEKAVWKTIAIDGYIGHRLN